MPHLHTQPGQHDHTITAYMVRVDGDEPRVLLHMHRKLHKLLPVGGHIELNETPWQAVAHELTEESGYLLEQLEILQPPHRIAQVDGIVAHPYPILANTHNITADHFHSDTAYAFVAQGDPQGTPDEGESLDIRWLTRSELDALTSNDVWENTRQTYRHILDTALTHWDRVPAAHFYTRSASDFYAEQTKV